MPRKSLEVADIFRDHGDTWRRANAGHVSLGQLKVMSAIKTCRTAALGGHVEQCVDCRQTRIAYNSCRNRHCPKCQGAVARDWLEAREADLLPVPYYHVVFTLPAQIADIAYQNKRVNCIVDGDTWWQAGVKYRHAKINTPETSKRYAKCQLEIRRGEQATNRLQQLTAKGFRTQPTGRKGRYGRALAHHNPTRRP